MPDVLMLSKEVSAPSSLKLLDLPWNDVIVSKILPYTLPSDWVNLRAVSRQLCIIVTEYFRSMKCLDLTKSQSLPKGVWKLLVQECCQLRVLKLSKFQLCDDDSIKELFENNSYLHHIDLSDCILLRNGSLQPLVVSCKNLNTIVLRNCPWVSIGAVEILAFHYRDVIKTVDFSGCNSINEPSIILFIKRQTKLESISLSNLAYIRDETLVVLSQRCPLLEYLDISRCWRVTDSGVQMLGEYCKHLRTLKVVGCGNVSEKSLTKLRSRLVQIDHSQSPCSNERQNRTPQWPRIQL